MGDWLLSIYNSIHYGFDALFAFLYDGLIKILSDFCMFYLKMTALFFYVKLDVAIQLCIDIFNEYLAPIGFSSEIEGYWSKVPEDIKSFIICLKIPDAISIILSGVSFSFLRKMIPFF